MRLAEQQVNAKRLRRLAERLEAVQQRPPQPSFPFDPSTFPFDPSKPTPGPPPPLLPNNSIDAAISRQKVRQATVRLRRAQEVNRIQTQVLNRLVTAPK